MEAGKLDKLVQIKAQATTRDALNQLSSTWNTITNGGSVWASIMPMSTSERMAAASNQMTVTHRVTIRYRSDINAAMRVYFGTRQLAIIGIRDPDERHEWLELVTVEAKNV